MAVSPENPFFVTISGTVTLSAADHPLGNGVARSGLYRTLYLVDKEFSECPAIGQLLAGGQSPTGPPGTCENPFYAGPFFLTPGQHIVRYLSYDNVWNNENQKTFNLSVTGGDTLPPDAFLIIDGSTVPAGVKFGANKELSSGAKALN